MGGLLSKQTSNDEDFVTPTPSARVELTKDITVNDKHTQKYGVKSISDVDNDLLKAVKELDSYKANNTVSEEEFYRHDNLESKLMEEEEFSREDDDILQKIDSLLSKGAQNLSIDEQSYSPLFETIVRNKINAFELILDHKPQDSIQKCNGLYVLEATIVFRRRQMFTVLVEDFGSFINTSETGTLGSLIKIGLEFGWTEEQVGDWYDHVQHLLGRGDYNSLKTLTQPQFDQAMDVFPVLMKEIRNHDPNLRQDSNAI